MSSIETNSASVDEMIHEQKDGFKISDYVGPAITFGLFIGVWYIISGVVLPEHKRFLLPTPHEVIDEGFLVWRTGERRGLQPILVSLWDSAKIALIGLTITIVLGMALAVIMSTRRWLERATWPFLVAVQSAPILALTPLILSLIHI